MAIRPDTSDLQELSIEVCLGAIDMVFGDMASRGRVKFIGRHFDEPSRVANSCSGLLRPHGCLDGHSIRLVYLQEVTRAGTIGEIRFGDGQRPWLG